MSSDTVVTPTGVPSETTETQEVVDVQGEVVLNEVVESHAFGAYTGNTKWFNDKLGYGFITICDGDEKGKDIFVHHSGVKPLNSNYKTLRKGEYVQFNIINGMNGLQAVDVTGIKGGPLMCDYVTPSKRLPPPPPPVQSYRARTSVESRGGDVRSGPRSPEGGWQTAGRRPYPQGPPKRVPNKNVAKYNKATRNASK